MTKLKRLLAVLMTAVILIGSVSVAASAAHTSYLDSAIINQYNSIDKVELNKAQKASLLLDDLDVMLAKEEIFLDIPLIGDIDLTSTDAALNSIYNITGNWLYGRLTVGDLVILETHRGNIANVRRTTADKTDVDVIESLVTYLTNCAPTLVKMIDPDESFSWGIVKGFLPPEFRMITDDFNGWLDDLLWELLHPVNEEAMAGNPTLDDFVQFLCDNQLGMEEGSARALIMGFAGVMPGFTLDIDAADANAYRAIEEGIYQALNAFVVPLLNNQLKDVIVSAVNSNAENGGDLEDIIEVDYVIEGYDFDRTKGLMEQLNTMFGSVVNLMLKPLAERPVGTTYTFEWDSSAPANGDYVTQLKDNLKGVMSMIIVAGGEAAFDPYAAGVTLETIGDYIARIAVDEFVKHMTIPSGATMEQVAYLGLRELCASVMPENYYALIESGSDADYRNAIIEIAADLGTYYLNNNIGLDCAMNTTSGKFIEEFVLWCEDYTIGLFDDTQYNIVKGQIANNVESVDGWDLIDTILWQFIPKDWLNYAGMFADASGAGVADDLTFESLINYFLDMIFQFDVDKLDTFFAHNASSPLYTKNVRVFFIDWLSSILNNAFTPSTASTCVPTGIDSFEKFINPVGNATTTICNILKALDEDKDLQTTVINLVTMLMGLSDPQSLSDVDIDIDSRIDISGGSIPANTKMRISNYSDGVNSGWLPVGETVIDQDQMYQIELVSLTNNAGLTASVTNGYIIPANGYVDVTVSGAVGTAKEARFDLEYYLRDENGARINDGTPLVASAYTYLYTESGNFSVVSAESSAHNVTFDSFSTYHYTTDVYSASLFSILATNESGFGTTGANVKRSIIGGNIPAGLVANEPASGSIVVIEDSSLTTDSYGTVNPYVSDVNPDAAQPYGIYEMTIQFEVTDENGSNSETSAARNHTVVVYDDFNLDGILDGVANANRQRVDYAADADAEWAAYQSAVSAGYELLQGNPDHSKMFDDVNADLAGVQNDYYTKAEAINAAIAALDAKAVTNAEELAALTALVNTYKSSDREDYLLYTYDRFKDAYNRANGLVNSQVDTGVAGWSAPAIPVFDLVYAKNQLTLWGGRLIAKTVDTRYLAEEVAKVDDYVESNYASDLWSEFAAQLATAQSYITSPSTTTQGKVNATRVNLMEAVLALKPRYVNVSGSATLNSNQMYIYIPSETNSLTGLVSTIGTYTFEPNKFNLSSDYYGTGSTVVVSDINGVVATYTIIVFGDLDGDGSVSYDEEDTIYYHATGENTSVLVEGTLAFVAADGDRNGIITESDLDYIV